MKNKILYLLIFSLLTHAGAILPGELPQFQCFHIVTEAYKNSENKPTFTFTQGLFRPQIYANQITHLVTCHRQNPHNPLVCVYEYKDKKPGDSILGFIIPHDAMQQIKKLHDASQQKTLTDGHHNITLVVPLDTTDTLLKKIEGCSGIMSNAETLEDFKSKIATIIHDYENDRQSLPDNSTITPRPSSQKYSFVTLMCAASFVISCGVLLCILLKKSIII